MLSQNTHSEKEQLEADRVLAANMLLQLQSRGNPPPSSQRTDNPLARNGKEKSHKRKKHSQDKELRASKKQRTGSAFHDSDAKSSRDDRKQSSQHGIIEALKIPSERERGSAIKDFNALLTQHSAVTIYIMAPTNLRYLPWMLQTFPSLRNMTHLIFQLSNLHQFTDLCPNTQKLLEHIKEHIKEFPKLKKISAFCSNSFLVEEEVSQKTVDGIKKRIGPSLCERIEVSTLVQINIRQLSSKEVPPKSNNPKSIVKSLSDRNVRRARALAEVARDFKPTPNAAGAYSATSTLADVNDAESAGSKRKEFSHDQTSSLVKKQRTGPSPEDEDKEAKFNSAQRGKASEPVTINLCDASDTDSDLSFEDDNSIPQNNTLNVHESAQFGQYDAVRSYIQSGGDIHSKREGCFILDYAVANAQIEIVELLLQKGANPALKNDWRGNNALHTAAEELNDISDKMTTVNKEIIELLLRHSPDILEQVNAKGMTALHIAVSLGKTRIVNTLIANGANPALKNKAGQNALHIAAHILDVINEMVKISGHFREALHIAACNLRNNENWKNILSGELSVANWLADIDNTLEENACSQDALADRLEYIEDLLEKIARLQVVLSVAARELEYIAKIAAVDNDIIEALLKRSPEILDEANAKDMTALHIAVSLGKSRMVNMLIAKGANPDLKNRTGQHALHVAQSNLEMIAKMATRDEYWQKALETIESDLEVITKMLKKGGDWQDALNITESILGQITAIPEQSDDRKNALDIMESILGKIERIAKKSGDSQKELDTAKNNLEKIKKISRDSTPIIDLLSKPRSNSVVEKNLSMSELVQINGSPVFRVAFPSSSSSSSGNVQQGQCTSDVSNSPR